MRQNRVGPDGELVAHPSRGTLMGNRGVLHDENGIVRRRQGSTRAWVTCLLEFKGRKRSLMQPRRYTELFFLDEAVALAAGHRPCGECRRDAYREFRRAWDTGHGTTQKLGDLDRCLHADRIGIGSRCQRTHEAILTDMPDGTFVLHAGDVYLTLGDRLLPFGMSGYGEGVKRPGPVVVEVLTPRATVTVLKAGYRPILHPTAEVSP